ncbi:response regulator [Polaromonas sp.]|uniref:response regulator n=1 Tax=Polaromonas sp. TaxID=1869339 RepID=UPI00375089F0
MNPDSSKTYKTGDDLDLPVAVPQILVIEDDPTQRLLTCAVLRSAGYRVAEAADGPEGVAMALRQPPDLIVCDVMMPGLNGYQLVEMLKLDEAFSTIPVIFLTALAERSHMRAGMTAGADDYLHKPFRALELRSSVEALLAKRKQQRELFSRGSKTALVAALQAQKETLAGRYETRLAQELNERWMDQDQAGAGREVSYARATVLTVNLFETSLRQEAPTQRLRDLAQRVYQAASDSLYLFGARYLVAAGDDLLAVFPEPAEPDAGKTRLLALRAAFGMQKSVQVAFGLVQSQSEDGLFTLPSLTIALHTGPLALIRLEDPLHGSPPLTLATGSAVRTVKDLGKHAQAQGWHVSCSTGMLSGIAHGVVMGKKARLTGDQAPQGLEVTELQAMASAP